MSDEGVERNNTGQKRSEEELASKQLYLLRRKYYVDVKQNHFGRFIKIAEMGNTYKSRLILTMNAAQQLYEKLTDMIKFDETYEPPEEGVIEPRAAIKSEVLVFESRRYYLDLKENAHGRFLRIAQTIATPRMNRTQIAIPAKGMPEMRDTLQEMLEKFYEGYAEYNGKTDESKTKQLTADNKTFVFHVGKDERGGFVRVCEMKQPNGPRNTISIPQSAFGDFRDLLNVMMENFTVSEEKPKEGGGDA